MSKLKTFAEKLFSMDNLAIMAAVFVCASAVCNLALGDMTAFTVNGTQLWLLLVWLEVRKLQKEIRNRHK